MSGEDIGDINNSQALAEIETIRRDYPFGGPTYTKEIDARKTALYQKVYDEPEEGAAPKGHREFPEILKQRKEVKPREMSRRRDKSDDDDDDTGLGSYPRRGYLEQWGTHEPTSRDIRQWDKAVSVAARNGVSPTQLAKLRDAMLETAPIADDEDGSDHVASDYMPPPISIEDDASWLTYKSCAEIAARHGVSKAAFHELASFVLGAGSAITEPQMIRAQRAAVYDLIASVGEDNAVRTVMNAQKALEHFRPSGPEIDRLLATPVAGALTLGDHPILIEMLGNVGSAIAHDALPREFASASGVYSAPGNRGNSMNQNSALAEIKRLQDERFAHSIGSREWKKIGEQLSSLFAVAYPGDQSEQEDRNGLGPLNRLNNR